MFKITPDPTFHAAVQITVPGLPEPLELAVVFKHKNRVAYNAWVDGFAGKADASILHEIIVSWSNVQDEAGQEVPYSLTALTNLLHNYAPATAELYAAYKRELTESRVKN